MWMILMNLSRRTRMLGCLGAAALVMSAGTAALAQDGGSYRDRGDRYQRATSSGDVRARTRGDNNTRPQYHGTDSRATVIRNRPTPQYHYVDRGGDSFRDTHNYRDNYRSDYYRHGNRHNNSSFRIASQINIGSEYGYHRPYHSYRPLHQTYYRPSYSYVRPYYQPSYGYHESYWHPQYNHYSHDRYYGSYYRPYRPYHSGSSISVGLGFGDDYRPYAPVIHTPRIGFGFYGVSTGSSYGVDYSHRFSYGSTYHSGPSYRHHVISYSDYAPRSSGSITVRYNYRR